METAASKLKVLLVDDEEPFRSSLRERLEMRGLQVTEADGGHEALRQVRLDPHFDVVILDKNMPEMDGQATLHELKIFRPEIPVIMLTGYGSVDSAVAVGRMGVFRYLSKPVPVDDLVMAIDAAAREKTHAMARLDMPTRKHTRWHSRLAGSHNLRPIVILFGFALLLVAALMPLPRGLVTMLDTPKTGMRQVDLVGGYPEYPVMAAGSTIAEHLHAKYRPPGMTEENRARHAARRALLMISLILVAAMFWATGAVPMGVTALIVAVVMYAAGVMRPDGIAQAFAKDAVVFIFGVLALSRVITSTGLDRRLTMLLLTPVRDMHRLLFLFPPLLALTCSFINESILIALMMPLFLNVYLQASHSPGLIDDTEKCRHLLVMFALMLCFACNMGGPGSPAAGGRNAVMVGLLADYGQAPSFLQWMKYGLPFVPVAGLVVGIYFYLALGRKIPLRYLDVASIARQGTRKLGPMNREEQVTAAISVLVVLLWIFGSERFGMGGPVLLGLVLLNLFGVMKWREITKIHWDVIFLYAGASALGKGLAVTGGALYLASGFIEKVGDSAAKLLLNETFLPMTVSLVSGLVTNIMSDGATVAALGPITVPLAQGAGLHPWVLGFTTAFASSFAHMLIIGTPANALVYIMCKDPITGKQLVTQRDFLRHGTMVFLLSFVVLWLWTFLGYWQWIGF